MQRGPLRGDIRKRERVRERGRDLFVDFPLISLVGFFGAFFFYLGKV